MEYIQGCCRVCLTSYFKGQSLFLVYNDEYLPEVIANVTGIKINENDGLPSTVCLDCADLLLQAQNIKRTCLSSDVLLRSQLNNVFNEQDQTTCSELKHKNLDDSILWSQLNENIFDSFVQTEKDENIQQELDKYFEINSTNESSRQEDDYLEQFSDGEQLSEDINKESDGIFKKEESFGDLAQSFACNLCHKKFNNKVAFKRHNKYHFQVKTKCPICPKEFSHKSNLKRHLSVHRDDCELICDQCGSVFTNSRELYEHFKSHNKLTEENREDYILDCELCGNKTTSLANHLVHMREKHNMDETKPFKCTLCGMKFASKQGMYRHIDNIHENNRRNLKNRDKNFLCNTCGKKFYTNFHLEVHMRSHTGERPFKCQVCQKSFSQLSGLKMHTFIHTGEKPFACKICKKKFNQYGHVREHLLTHSDERPHVCKICNHSFRVKGNLTAHMLIHTGKKPFSCNNCGKGFMQRGKLKAHYDKNHAVSTKITEGGGLMLVGTLDRQK